MLQLTCPRCVAQARGSRLATAMVGAPLARSAAGRWVHRLGPRVASAVAVPQFAQAAAPALGALVPPFHAFVDFLPEGRLQEKGGREIPNPEKRNSNRKSRIPHMRVESRIPNPEPRMRFNPEMWLCPAREDLGCRCGGQPPVADAASVRAQACIRALRSAGSQQGRC